MRDNQQHGGEMYSSRFLPEWFKTVAGFPSEVAHSARDLPSREYPSPATSVTISRHPHACISAGPCRRTVHRQGMSKASRQARSANLPVG